MQEGSLSFKWLLVISEAWIPKKNKVITKPSCISLFKGEIKKNKGKAISEPSVPGAFFDNPDPKPSATRCQKLENKNFILTKV